MLKPDRMDRRRFLANLLFAGGAFTAAVLTASDGEAEKKPTPTATPKCPPTDRARIGGMVAPPTAPPPTAQPTGSPSPKAP